MKLNSLEIEWTDTGCRATASGFPNTQLTCPRCQELLPRDTPHLCGDQADQQLATNTKTLNNVGGPESLARRHPNKGRSSTGS